jgi:Zn finger protein HypA/HybF involved in hydrogenase expression
MSRSLIGKQLKCDCATCNHEFTTTITEENFLKEEDYKDLLYHRGIDESDPNFKKEMDKYLTLEEYYLECPNCHHSEQVGTSEPQWFSILQIQ